MARSSRLAGRNAGLVVGITAVAVLIGIAIAVARPTTYVAESRLLVGTFEVRSEAVPGYVLASQSLAANYERLADTEAVLGPLAERLGMSTAEVRDRIDVLAVPDSAILRVRAADTDEARAREMSEAMAGSIDRAVADLAETEPQNGDALLAEFETAARDRSAAQVGVADAAAALADATQAGNAATIAAAQQALDEATAELTTAEIRTEAISEQYLNSQQRTSSSSGVRPLGGSIVSEASTLLSTATTVALAMLLGFALALVVARLREGRHAPAPDPSGRHTTNTSGTGRAASRSGSRRQPAGRW